MAAGVKAFMDGKPGEAILQWDLQIAADPTVGPHHWQRGIALYYAGKFQEGCEQFESHRKVNPEDVENAVWHYMCVAKVQGVEEARRRFIAVSGDRRVPMREIHALFAGKGDAAAVLAAAELGQGEALRNQRCYAHLYLGLFYEAQGDAGKAEHHMTLAAGQYRMEHYMGKTAQVHCLLRKWKVPPASGTRNEE